MNIHSKTVQLRLIKGSNAIFTTNPVPKICDSFENHIKVTNVVDSMTRCGTNWNLILLSLHKVVNRQNLEALLKIEENIFLIEAVGRGFCLQREMKKRRSWISYKKTSLGDSQDEWMEIRPLTKEKDSLRGESISSLISQESNIAKLFLTDETALENETEYTNTEQRHQSQTQSAQNSIRLSSEDLPSFSIDAQESIFEDNNNLKELVTNLSIQNEYLKGQLETLNCRVQGAEEEKITMRQKNDQLNQKIQELQQGFFEKDQIVDSLQDQVQDLRQQYKILSVNFQVAFKMSEMKAASNYAELEREYWVLYREKKGV